MQYSNYHRQHWLLQWHRDRLGARALGLKESWNSLLKTGGNSTWGIFTLLLYISCSCLYLPYLYHHKALRPFSKSGSVFFFFLFFKFSNKLCHVAVDWPFFLHFIFSVSELKTPWGGKVRLNQSCNILLHDDPWRYCVDAVVQTSLNTQHELRRSKTFNISSATATSKPAYIRYQGTEKALMLSTTWSYVFISAL